MAIPTELLTLLRQASFDPAAVRNYNVFDGGFRWSDEFPSGFFDQVIRLDYWLDRYLAAHRASLILGKEDHRFRSIWQEVQREVPGWPGLRAERSDTSLATELIATQQESLASFDAFEERIS
jgi:hypothetical protein